MKRELKWMVAMAAVLAFIVMLYNRSASVPSEQSDSSAEIDETTAPPSRRARSRPIAMQRPNATAQSAPVPAQSYVGTSPRVERLIQDLGLAPGQVPKFRQILIDAHQNFEAAITEDDGRIQELDAEHPKDRKASVRAYMGEPSVFNQGFNDIQRSSLDRLKQLLTPAQFGRLMERQIVVPGLVHDPAFR